MRRTKALLVFLAGVAALVPALTACRVGYPFRGPGYDPSKGVVHPAAGRDVFVAVTRGDVASGRGSAFSEQLQSVLSTMDEHDGLIGYSVRKQLVGRRVWTMSVWIDRASMERFVRSPQHRDAISRGGIPRSAFVAAYTSVEVGRVPFGWPEAERLLEAGPSRGMSDDE